MDKNIIKSNFGYIFNININGFIYSIISNNFNNKIVTTRHTLTNIEKVYYKTNSDNHSITYHEDYPKSDVTYNEFSNYIDIMISEIKNNNVSPTPLNGYMVGLNEERTSIITKKCKIYNNQYFNYIKDKSKNFGDNDLIIEFDNNILLLKSEPINIPYIFKVDNTNYEYPLISVYFDLDFAKDLMCQYCKNEINITKKSLNENRNWIIKHSSEEDNNKKVIKLIDDIYSTNNKISQLKKDYDYEKDLCDRNKLIISQSINYNDEDIKNLINITKTNINNSKIILNKIKTNESKKVKLISKLELIRPLRKESFSGILIQKDELLK